MAFSTPPDLRPAAAAATARSRVLRLGVALCAVLLVAPASHAIPEQCNDTARLTRSFVPPPARPAAHAAGAFEITQADLFDLYAYGLEIRIGLSPFDEVYPYDVGLTDDPARKTFDTPEIDFDTIAWRMVDPATTPYAALYPGATHALVTTDDPEFDGTRYQFFTLADAQLVFEGYLDVPATGGGPIDDRYTAPLALLPINAEMLVSDSGVFYYDDEFAEAGIDPEQPFPAATTLGFHGAGTLVRPDGSTVEVGSFYQDFDVYETDGSGDLFDFESFYSIYGVDGTWLQFRIAEPPGSQPGDEIPIQGEVYIDAVEYWEVSASSVSAEAGPGGAPWSVYPNPTADWLRFSEPLTATVYDVMGRAVREANRAREVDLRGLAPGTYVVRGEHGRSRAVTVRR